MRTRTALVLLAAAVCLGLVGGWRHGTSSTRKKDGSYETDKPRVSGARPRSVVETVQSVDAERQLPPPEFIYARIPAPPSVENDPTSNNYDAVKLWKVTGVSLHAIMLKEPRHAVFAPYMDKEIAHYFAKDFESSGVKAKVLGSDCRSRICEITVEAESEEELKKAAILLQYVPIGHVFQAGPEVAPNTRVFTVAWAGDDRSAAMWIEGYPNTRAKALADLRARAEVKGGLPAGYPPIPADVAPPSHDTP